MRPLRFRYLSFQDPLLQPEEWCDRDAWLIFPTQVSRNTARRQLQPFWSLSRLRLVTMEEFKEQLFSTPLPLLREEKRTLAFFASLDNQARDFFRIHSYFQSIDLANQFFSLWEESSEAGLNLETAAATLAAAGAELLPWQEKTLQELIRIRGLYSAWIGAHGFSDRIFNRGAERFDVSPCPRADEIVLVNILHLTGLEKWLLRQLAAADRQVTLLCQLPSRLMDEETLSPRPFTAAELGTTAGRQITILECPNTFALYIRFIAAAAQHGITHAVDVTPQPCAIHHLLSPGQFRLPASSAMSGTTLYRFFSVLRDLLEALVWDSTAGTLLLPLPALLAAFECTEFSHPLLGEGDAVQNARQQERAITLLHQLQSEDYLYLDLEGRFFQTQQRPRRDLEPLATPLLRLLQRMMEVQDLAGFSRLIDDPEGVPIRRILSGHENRFTNLLQLFYQTLADFTAIGSLGIMDDWRSLLPGESRTTAARAILRLFLDYIKSVRVRYEWNSDRQNQIEFLNFGEIGNLTFEHLALLRVTEGQLPRTRSAPWLLNEQQRSLLGFDSADDLRLREKYAFFRLALATPQLFIFTIKNISKNIEPGSFVEELCIACPDMVTRESLPDVHYREFCRQFFTTNTRAARPAALRGERPDFFILPFEPAADFPEGQWRLSFSAYSQLRKNPFAYAVRTVARVPDWPDSWEAGLNPRLLGKIAQAVFDACWLRFIKDALPFSTFERIFTHYGEAAIADLFSRSSDLYFKLPKNHELTYFREFILPLIRASCQTFYTQLHERFQLDRMAPRVYPEAGFTSETEKTPKLFLTAAASGLPLDLFLLGRADLRIEYGEPVQAFLVDYKTGQYEEEQLWFYELFYYLIEQPEMLNRVHSCIYKILQSRFEGYYKKRMKKQTKQEVLTQFRLEIAATLQEIAAAGYHPPDRSARDLDHLHDMIRMEIFHPR
ncbi:MAG TPA: PD-(D/E)XK nuclease family protein [bacterium]|nr:PD-(D/E)XK nuclease family protein [bacterium]